MAGSINFQLIDHSREQSGFTVYTPDLDGTNVDGYTSTVLTNELGDFKAAVDALTLMNEVSISVVATKILSVPSTPADPNAQREQGIKVNYFDTVTNKKYWFTIPGIDRSLVAQEGTDLVDHVNNVLVAAMIAEFEANFVSELGNPVTVYKVSLVGRNN